MTATKARERAPWRERAQVVGHYLTAFGIFLKEVAKAEHFDEHAAAVVFFLAAGFLLAIGTFFHRRLEERWPAIQAAFYGVEAAVLAVLSVVYVEEGKRFLEVVLAPVVVAFAVLAFREVRRHRNGAPAGEAAEGIDAA